MQRKICPISGARVFLESLEHLLAQGLGFLVIARYSDDWVIAKGITQIFERIIQAEGRYYFDAPDFIPDDSFDKGD